MTTGSQIIYEALQDVLVHLKIDAFFAGVIAAFVTLFAGGRHVMTSAEQEVIRLLFGTDPVILYALVMMAAIGLALRLVVLRLREPSRGFMLDVFAMLVGFAAMWGLFFILFVGGSLVSAILSADYPFMSRVVQIFTGVLIVLMWTTYHVGVWLNTRERFDGFKGQFRLAWRLMKGVAKEEASKTLDEMTRARESERSEKGKRPEED